MIEQHIQRISPTVLYAMAQDNNHGTSEAVALYVAGMLLEKNNSNSPARSWKNKGRRWIENRISRLILDDGTFSQYSLNYHRVMLDCLCFAEFARRQLGDRPFSKTFYRKMQLATEWLFTFSSVENGDGPNIGANDGANVLPLAATPYRDYRPSVQLASVLFSNKRAYDEVAMNQGLKLLGLDHLVDVKVNENSSKVFSEGGFVFLRKGIARCYIRYPKYRFRPSQCDALHPRSLGSR